MWARTRLKIGWGDLLYGLGRCLVPGDPKKHEREILNFWPAAAEDSLVCFSVRSGFDLALQALDLKEGDEIVFSALNIRGMVKIARRQGLRILPVDLDLEHMGPKREALEAAISPKTKAVIVAHLFGSRLDLDPVFEIARKNDVLVIEDCAQVFDGQAYQGDQRSDIAMFSFGPLKTATALGGAILRIKDPALRARMAEIQASYPVQKQRAYAKRLLKFAAVKLVCLRPVFSVIDVVSRLTGKDFEDPLSDFVRGVAKLGSARKIRSRCSPALLAVLARRLRTWREGSLAPRAQSGHTLLKLLDNAVTCPGAANKEHSYWVFPILADDPLDLIRELRSNGFDGANLPRSQTVAAPEDRQELSPITATTALSQLVVLPCYPEMPIRELEREAGVVKAYFENRATHPKGAVSSVS